MRTLVAVVGPGGAEPDLVAVADEVGALLARRGAGVVCGGLGGVMEAACRGARANGGLTVALLPGVDRRDANDFAEVVVPTGLGEARNILVVRAAVAVIAVGGEYGTLTEIAFALKLGTPVVGLSTWELSKGGRRRDAFPTAATAAEAVERALAVAGSQSDAGRRADRD